MYPGEPIKTEQREQILTETMELHSGKLLAVIRKMVRNQVEAEDILQDVFTEYIETYDLSVAIETLGAWLVQTAKNKTIDRFRRKKTQKNYVEMVDTSIEALDSNTPEDEMKRAWLRHEIDAALKLMPQSQREVFIQHELEGKSFEEIAHVTGESVSTLLSRKRYAVLFLKNQLKEIYDELEK